MNTSKRNDALVISLLTKEKMTQRDVEEAGRLLYHEYLPAINAFLQYRVGIRNPSLIDEIVIETIERATTSIRKFDPSRAKFISFLIGFAWRVAKEMLRKELTTICFDEVAECEMIKRSESSFDTAALLHDLLRGRYARCLESLDDKYRLLIEMALEQKPPEDYMRLFNVSRPTYRKRKERAITTLRENISKMGPGTITTH